MNAPRLPISEINSLLSYPLHDFQKEKIVPVIKECPALDTLLFRWNSGSGFRTQFSNYIRKTVINWCSSYPDYTYEQLKNKAIHNQLSSDEQKEIDKELSTLHQGMRQTEERINQKKQYRNQNRKKSHRKRKGLINHYVYPRFKEHLYEIHHFSEASSPFHQQNYLNMLTIAFDTLEKAQRALIFSHKKSLLGDEEWLTLQKETDKETVSLSKQVTDLDRNRYATQDKEKQLRQRLKELDHLTHLMREYRMTDDPGDLTSPEEQMDELEKLLAEKRRQ